LKGKKPEGRRGGKGEGDNTGRLGYKKKEDSSDSKQGQEVMTVVKNGKKMDWERRQVGKPMGLNENGHQIQ